MVKRPKTPLPRFCDTHNLSAFNRTLHLAKAGTVMNDFCKGLLNVLGLENAELVLVGTYMAVCSTGGEIQCNASYVDKDDRHHSPCELNVHMWVMLKQTNKLKLILTPD